MARPPPEQAPSDARCFFMIAGSSPWVVVVIADPSERSPKAPTDAIEGPAVMLRRALSLTAPDKVSCVIGNSFLKEWVSVYDALRPSNRHSLLPDEPVLEGVKRCLTSIEARDPKANVTVIPYNHCAVEETSWLDSAKGALRLGSRNRNTVFMLHDNPVNDPRVALKMRVICSSSGMVGTSSALLALCMGKRATSIVNLIADRPEAGDASTDKETASADSPLNVVHIRLIDEYTRLQRADVWQAPSRRVDIRA